MHEVAPTGRHLANATVSDQPLGAALFNSAIGLAVIDAGGRFLLVNEAFCRITGYEEEELLSRDWASISYPEDTADKVARTWRMGPAQPTSILIEKRCVRKDGTEIWIRSSISPLHESGRVPLRIALVEDITERKRAEQALAAAHHRMGLDMTARKQAEEALGISERRLRLALESGRMYVFEWDPKSDVMLRSAECAAVLGVPTQETSREFFARLHPADCSHYKEVLSMLTPANDSYRTQFRKRLQSGKMCWIEARGRGLFDSAGNLVRIIGIAADVTARKESEDALRTLSAHLIHAQDEERKRVARELHDGVSQTLAVISIEMARAAKATPHVELSSQLERLYSKLQGVLSDIGHLSHELHPTTLKHLGLSTAIRVLCEEITHAHGIQIDFIDRNVPRNASKDTALCLYRIAQESLQNVVKHSRSKHAWVELGGDPNEIFLHIWDEGVGFDTHASKPGLGLVSMRERLRLIGGKIQISSRQNSGTRIEACAPLERNQSQGAA